MQPVKNNYDFDAVMSRLTKIQRIGTIGMTGWTAEGYAYVAVNSLQGNASAFDDLERAIDELLDAPGLILDIRANTGGNERHAQRIAGIFADSRRAYAKSKVRAGREHDVFIEQPAREIHPRPGKTFTRPVVCLIGPRCMSSGEGFVKMMAVLPHVTLVGQATRGASGNPAPVILPNGITVFYSRWVDMLPDGTITETKGIPPNIVVQHEGAGDPTWEAGLAELKRQLAN
jgi:C-terminal processing protease CtpA/Prc